MTFVTAFIEQNKRVVLLTHKAVEILRERPAEELAALFAKHGVAPTRECFYDYAPAASEQFPPTTACIIGVAVLEAASLLGGESSLDTCVLACWMVGSHDLGFLEYGFNSGDEKAFGDEDMYKKGKKIYELVTEAQKEQA